MTEKELAQKVESLEDVEEIKQLHAAYVNNLTRLDWDGMAGCFSKNGTMDFIQGAITGRDNLQKFFKEIISRQHVGLEGNYIVHPIISVEGDQANGNWMYYMQATHDRPLTRATPLDWIQGFYDAVYEKEDGKWRINYLKYRARLFSDRVG